MRPVRLLASLPVIAALIALAVPAPSAAAPPRTLWEELNSPVASCATGAYDPVRKQFVTISTPNTNGSGEGTVWSYDLSLPAPQWKHLLPYSPAGTVFPNPNWGMVYDPVRDRFATAGPFLSATTPRTWTVGSSSSSGGRNTIVYDPFADRLLSYGANALVQLLSLASPSSSWTTLTTAGVPPPSRSRHSVILDKDHNRLIVFGGSDRNDVWALSLAGTPTWSQIFPLDGPPAGRSGHVAVFDSRHCRMVMMGGENSTHQYFTDTWELSLTPGSERWSLIPGTPTPRPTVNAAADYDSLNDRLIIYASEYLLTNNISSLKLDGTFVCTRHSPAALGTPMYGRSGLIVTPCAFDSLRHQLVVYSGNQLWARRLWLHERRDGRYAERPPGMDPARGHGASGRAAIFNGDLRPRPAAAGDPWRVEQQLSGHRRHLGVAARWERARVVQHRGVRDGPARARRARRLRSDAGPHDRALR